MEKALVSGLLFSVADSSCVDIDSPVCQAHCLCIGEVRDREYRQSQVLSMRLLG